MGLGIGNIEGGEIMSENCYKRTNRWALVLMIPYVLILFIVTIHIELGVLHTTIGTMLHIINTIMWALTVCMIGTYLENVEKMGS